MSGLDNNGPGLGQEGICSILDTDLYKFTMQCVLHKYYKSFETTQVTYGYTNRTPHMKFTRTAVDWLRKQIANLDNISLTPDELAYLKATCPYLNQAYLDYLAAFRFSTSTEVKLTFMPDSSDSDVGSIQMEVQGTWLRTILYEIPLLALSSECYFKFVATNWTYAHQTERAHAKAQQLLEGGCQFAEFGTRRRRDYHTQDLVVAGLVQAAKDCAGAPGLLTGTSNVHFAYKYGLTPIGTMAHEWIMGIAAVTGDYENANEVALDCWIDTFGEGVLGIALTDTFGTEAFLRSFSKPVGSKPGAIHTDHKQADKDPKTYAQVFTGVRQDSGDPMQYLKLVREFYDSQGIAGGKVITYSDSLNVEKCLLYKTETEKVGLVPKFGIGTFLTNNFDGSPPLNIVIKLQSADGRPAIKLSDNKDKNIGDKATVAKVKRNLGYNEREWKEGDESHRWNDQKA